MDNKTNKYISVSYQLYDITNDAPNLLEETSEDKPFAFLSGFGITLEAFENKLTDLNKGDKFDFTLASEEAYGEYVDERVIDLDKSIFTVDGKFDSANIYKDAVVPLQNEDGNRFMGRVLSISDDKVKIDLNHPLAGKKLNFKGEVLESREATNDEIEQFAKLLSGEGGCGSCGGHCGGNCGDGCEGDGCENGKKGCGNGCCH